MTLTVLESAVLDKLLDAPHPVLDALRDQRAGLSVTQREYTGVGFFTDFAVADDRNPAPVTSDRIIFGDVVAKMTGLMRGARFLLYVERGFLSMLEGYTYEEPWPEDVSGFWLEYSEPNRAEALRELES